VLYDRIAQRHSLALSDVPKKYTKRQLERLAVMIEEEGRHEQEILDKQEREMKNKNRGKR
jgi:hypothetical protein